MDMLFVLYALLAWFGLVWFGLVWFGHRHTLASSEAAVKAGADATRFLQGKLRCAKALESMGMVQNLKARWAQRFTHCITSRSKVILYIHKPLSFQGHKC